MSHLDLMNRRRFLSLGAFALGSVSVNSRLPAKEEVFPSTRISPLSSIDGLLDATIEAGTGWVALAGGLAYLSTYNGRAPGPLLEARPGDVVRLRFLNNLSEPTNLHFHGLHVPPTGNADNSFLKIPPGEAFDYRFTLPTNHSGGLFWYHPHVHGSVARQLFHGLAGPIIVRSDVDEIPEIRAAEEHVLVLKDFDLSRDGTIPPPTSMDSLLGREGSLQTVNGEIRPTFTIAEGGLLRLRILNACNARFFRLKLEDHPLYIIGTDGGALPEPIEEEELLLTPGQRVDILIRATRLPGQYSLLNLPYARSGMGMGGSMGSGSSQILANVLYQGRVPELLELPRRLVEIPALPLSDRPSRSFVLGQRGMMRQGTSFLINGRAFDADRLDTQVELGTVEEWEIVNNNTMDHPFHLHTNPFQVIGSDGEPERAWRDVVLVKAGRRERFRVRFSDYPGKTVYHCHIAEHEDLGMMGVIEFLG